MLAPLLAVTVLSQAAPAAAAATPETKAGAAANACQVTWGLIVLFVHSTSNVPETFSTSNVPTTLSVQGFTSERACKAAGDQVNEDAMRLKVFTKMRCVASDVPEAPK